MNAYGDPKLQQKLKNGFKAAGKKLDMGKACIRFKAADDLALDAVADVVASTSLDKFVATAKAAVPVRQAHHAAEGHHGDNPA